MLLSAKHALATAGLTAILAFGPAALAFADAPATDTSEPAAPATLAAGAGLAATPATFSEDQLETVVGTYTYNGETHEITARQAIEDATSLDAARNADGTYNAPSADTILTYARNRILNDLVAQAGITVTDEEIAAYAQQSIGTDDIATIAQYYGMGEDQARAILSDAACVIKLRDQTVGALGAAPQPPVAPDGDTTEATEAYGGYVRDLVGDAWDAEAGAWASMENVFAQALDPYAFDGTMATYEMAQVAYYVAYSLYQQEASAQLTAWQTYVNQYLGEATIQIATLRS